MTDKKKKERSKEYEKKLSISGSLDDVLKASVSDKDKEKKEK